MTCSWQGLWGSSIIYPWIFCLFLIFFFWSVFPDIRLETTRAFKVPEVCDTLHQRNISGDDPYSRHSPVSKYPGPFNHYLLYLYTVALHVSTCMTWIYCISLTFLRVVFLKPTWYWLQRKEMLYNLPVISPADVKIDVSGLSICHRCICVMSPVLSYVRAIDETFLKMLVMRMLHKKNSTMNSKIQIKLKYFKDSWWFVLFFLFS